MIRSLNTDHGPPSLQVLEELQKDPFPSSADCRPSRCTGTALSVAAGLLGACVPGTGARILTFVGGPATEGGGTIVAKELAEPVRSHKDLDKDAAPHYNKAVKFYEGLAKQLVTQGHVLDLFACALDQVRGSIRGRNFLSWDADLCDAIGKKILAVRDIMRQIQYWLSPCN